MVGVGKSQNPNKPYLVHLTQPPTSIHISLTDKRSIMFPLHHGDELCFQTNSSSNNSKHPHQQISPQDLLLLHSPPHSIHAGTNSGKPRSRRSKSDFMQTSGQEDDDNHKKKMMHRDVERQRRQDMAALHSSLRSLLPLEFVRGKRSMSDHMNEAVNYIKYLQKKIKEMGERRDELRRLNSVDGMNNNSSPSSVTVRPCLGGMEIVFSSGARDHGSPLSRVLKLLLEEGISVVSCFSTKVNETVFHTVQTEVEDPTCLNLCELRQKLRLLVP